MHKQMTRLYEAAEKLQNLTGQSNLARVLNTSPQTVKNWEARGISKQGLLTAQRVIGCDATWLETGLGLMSESTTISRETNASGIYKRNADDVYIKQYETAGSMGNGLVLRDQPGVIQNLQVNKEWLEKNVKTYSNVRNLAIVTGFGDSMKPMFNSGDPLLIDIGIKAVEYEGIYFFRIGDEGYIKRLQRIPTEDGLIIRAKSENSKAYDSFDITKKMDFEVLGVVLKVWCSTDY
jgi:phage repressor protein C with HTH and peptisase S24 domain